MRPRGRTGLVLSTRAHARVQREAALIRRRLNDPPPFPETAARAETQGIRKERDREEERLNARLKQLQGVLADYGVDPDHVGGYRVTPGCLIELRYEDEQETKRYEITMMGSEEAGETLKPDATLAQALQNKEIGELVRYVLPDGRRLAVMVESIDG